MLDVLAQTGTELPGLADRWGFAAVGIALIMYLMHQHRQVMEKVAPMLEKTAIVLERVAKMLDDMEHERSK